MKRHLARHNSRNRFGCTAALLTVWTLATISPALWAQAPPNAAPAATAASTSAAKPVINSELDGELFYVLLLAELAQFEGKTGETYAIYVDAAKRQPRDELFERATRIALEARDGIAARQVATDWATQLPNSALAQNYLFQIHFAQGNYALGLPPLKAFLSLTPDNTKPNIILSLNGYFTKYDDKLAAASELERVLLPYTTQPTTGAASRLVLARANIHAGRYSAALAQLQTLTVEHPASIDGWLLKGALELQENQFASAEQSLRMFLQLAQTQKLASNHSAYSTAYLQLAQLAEQRKDYDLAQNWLSKIEDDKERLEAQVRRASILAKQGKLAQARALIQELPEPTTAQARAKLMAEVQLLRDHKHLPEAIVLLGQALADNPKDTGLMYELSTLHDKAKDFDKMETLLRSIMMLEPRNQAAYNALGYSLADRGERLDEAQRLIEYALDITPNDPYIVDSLAWVFFRAGKLELALTTLQSAYKTRADAEIGAHMGEVLWRLNRKDEAIKVWQDAKAINPDNETLVETIKRLRVPLQ
jgi:tetratricopeptide (TPR) repeat protein